MIVGEFASAGSVLAGLERLGQAEVEHLDGPIRAQLDVGRLQIAMDDALLVRGLQGVGDLSRDIDRLVDRQRAVLEPLGERRSLDQLERRAPNGARLFDTVNPRDVRVIESGEHLCLALESRKSIRLRRHAFGKELDGDIAMQLRVAGPIDLAHSAFAQLVQDAIRTNGLVNHDRVQSWRAEYITVTPTASSSRPAACPRGYAPRSAPNSDGCGSASLIARIRAEAAAMCE